ncbi:MAG: hypothetical protein E7421_04510 [Ruminococcaceae bacterium]|nr:hypothetical protein [Oscillospiraceae bacterium]
MDNSTKTCPNCGATCKAKDEYCKSCWKKFGTETADDSVTESMNQSEWVDWELFIEKNADRYIETYKKNENKKIFAHINWAALCFGLNWVLYRKMTKVAVVSFVIMSFVFLLIFTVSLLPYRTEIKSLYEDIKPYEEYLDRGGKTVLIDAQGRPYSPEFVQKGASAQNKLAKIQIKGQLKCLLIVPFFCAFWGFFGDAIYKMHIEEKIRSKNGGTSVAELIGGRIVLSLLNLLLLNPLTSLIIGLLYR